MNTHDHYEQLCALAVSGQASTSELEDLRSHLESCSACRIDTRDFASLSAHGLASIAVARSNSRIPSGMTARFLARAHSEGIVFGSTSRNNGSRFPWLRVSFGAISVAIAAVLLFAVTALSKGKTWWSYPTKPSTAAAISKSSPGAKNPSQVAIDTLRQQLASVADQMGSATDMVNRQRADLESATRNIASLDSQLAEAQKQTSTFQGQNAEEARKIEQLEAELSKAKSDVNASNIALTVQENELRDLRKRVSEQADELAQQQALSAKGSGILDLVTARNLHIIDVHDRDGSGKNQRTYGRIFYTEGQSLIFYAYDLTDPHELDAKVSFYVWGQRLGSEKPIKSLGILHSDDETDGRWILTFDDSSVLAQIDSVFVTAESSKKPAREPRGQKILFAFLGGSPNHP